MGAEKNEKSNAEISKIVLEASVNASIVEREANKNLGITQEYNKENRDKLWDSTKGKREYKDKVFGEKNTFEDPISGKTLHKSEKAAQQKYHMKNQEGEKVSAKWAGHSAETDHVVALKDAHNTAKYNPFLSDDDFKEIMNTDENYRLLSKAMNASKGDKSDIDVLMDKSSDLSVQGKLEVVKGKAKAEAALQTRFAARTAKNMASEFVSGAADTLVAAAIPLTTEAVRKMVEVAKGEKTIGDATKEMGKVVVETAVAGGTNKLLVHAMTKQFLNSNNPMLQNLAGCGGVSQIIATAVIVKESAMRYINGEIDGQEFVEEVGEKGAHMMAGMIGGAVGKEIGFWIGAAMGSAILPGAGTVVGAVAGEVIGNVLGTIITTIACSAILSAYRISKTVDDYKIKERQMRRLEAEAVREMENQRNIFKAIVEKANEEWDSQVMEGFDELLGYACESTFDIDGVTEGLDNVMAVFGKSVRFKTIGEYESQLSQSLKIRL